MIRNITLSADEELIRKVREKAQKEHSSLNARFREWLGHYTQSKGKSYQKIMKELDHIDAGGPFTRDQLNER